MVQEPFTSEKCGKMFLLVEMQFYFGPSAERTQIFAIIHDIHTYVTVNLNSAVERGKSVGEYVGE